MAHCDAREGKWRWNWLMESVASTLHTTSEHGVPNITTAYEHTSVASSRLKWRPCRFKWTSPFRRKTKSGFCACAITFQMQSTSSDFSASKDIFMANGPPVGQVLFIIEGSRSHSDTPQSVGISGTSDQPDAETSTWQHTPLTRNRQLCPRRNSNPQSQQASGRRPTPYTARPLGSALVRIMLSKIAVVR